MEGIVGIEFVVLSLLYINGSPPPEDCKKQVTEWYVLIMLSFSLSLRTSFSIDSDISSHNFSDLTHNVWVGRRLALTLALEPRLSKTLDISKNRLAKVPAEELIGGAKGISQKLLI